MDEEYLEAVLDVVATIPAGRVMTYGTVADVVHEALGRGGPRQVGRVMARAGGDVPWWRVVNASGEPPARLHEVALRHLRADGCPLSDDERAEQERPRVVLRRALWWPDDDAGPTVGS